jgi:hypothetical protein
VILWTNVEAWCYANPKLALFYNILRGQGFDAKKILNAIKVYADSRLILPPTFATSVNVQTIPTGTLVEETTVKTTVEIDPKLAQGAASSAIKKATASIGVATLLLGAVLLALSPGCTPAAKAPTAVDLATYAVTLTDQALTIAIDMSPVDDDLAVWDDRVRWVEQAASAIRESKSVCPSLPYLAVVAEGISCEPCSRAIVVAQEGLKCPK